MDKDSRKLFDAAVIQMVLFTVFTVLVKLGCFEAIDTGFYTLTGVNGVFYDISRYLGYLSFIPVVFFACQGLFQLVRSKSLLKVDFKLICLALLYCAMLVFYVLFDKIAISMRPDMSEASYPSSHTLLFVCINVTSAFLFSNMTQSRRKAVLIRIFFVVFTVIGVLSRLVCGCHWLTDIFGGLLLSSSLLSFYFAAI